MIETIATAGMCWASDFLVKMQRDAAARGQQDGRIIHPYDYSKQEFYVKGHEAITFVTCRIRGKRTYWYVNGALRSSALMYRQIMGLRPF